MGDVVIMRGAYKRAKPAVPVLRRAYKRGPPVPEGPPPRPRWFLDVLMAGAVRCPRKWSDIAIEGCAQIQDTQPGGCVAIGCAFFGKGALLMDEVRAAKKSGIAPKTGPRGKLAILPGD